jgi:hypothetical protein
MPQGVRIGTTPLSYPIESVSGGVVLILKRRGYRDQTIELPADRDSDKMVALVKAPRRPAETPVPAASPGVTPSGSIDPFAPKP